MQGMIGTKLGMTQIFNDEGKAIPVTVVQLLKTTVMGTRTKDANGYEAVIVAAGVAKEKHLSRPVLGQFRKAGVEPARHVAEFQASDLSAWTVGTAVDASVFDGVKRITVTGISKGHGFSGTIKRYNFSRGPMTHGSKNKRAPGSVGAHTYPARTFPGQRMPGHYGDKQHTFKNLQLVRVDAERNLLFIKGAVPGATNAKVIVRKQSNG